MHRRWPHQRFLPTPSSLPGGHSWTGTPWASPQEPEEPTLAGPGHKSCHSTNAHQRPFPSDQEKEGQQSLRSASAKLDPPPPRDPPKPAHSGPPAASPGAQVPPHGPTFLVWTSTYTSSPIMSSSHVGCPLHPLPPWQQPGPRTSWEGRRRPACPTFPLGVQTQASGAAGPWGPDDSEVG